MLDGRGKVRITDFGLASFADDDRTGEIAGTPAYMAPEQIAGGPLSPQTDLYAVGLLLFELLAGTPAYGSASLAERSGSEPHRCRRCPRACPRRSIPRSYR
jgi:serine/threonine protein kinase